MGLMDASSPCKSVGCSITKTVDGVSYGTIERVLIGRPC
jgi:hypothetical protein